MFAKIFGQIFDSSIAEDYNCRRMFIDLLVLADSDGVVDMTQEAISRRTNVPIEQVTRYIKELQQPDPSSRSKIEQGRRLIPIDSGRAWGWQIVNYSHYRKLRDEEARRSYFRDVKRKQRKKAKANVQDKMVDTGGHCQTVASAYSSVLKEEDSKGKPNLVPTPEDIYRAYPRHESKPDALKAIKKAMHNGFGASFLLERTIAYSKTQPPRSRFTPLPATWFNAERFNDDPREWIRSEKQTKPNPQQERLDRDFQEAKRKYG